MDSGVFRKYLEEVFTAEGADRVMEALECPPSVSVRLNPGKFRRTGEENGGSCGMPLEIAGAKVSGEVPWCSCGQFLESRPVFTLDPLMHSGAYYVQDSSSMFVGFVFRQMLGKMKEEGKLPEDRNLRVLDLCAAPGGKTTDLAASLREALGDRFLLVSNEVMKNRAGTLADNVALWGDPNVVVTSADPAAFARLRGFFDIVLTDVPCSGEGMFRKDAEAEEQWSEETVALCEGRQRRILADMWPALREGGVIIYSTCTFNRRENDGNVLWIASELGAAHLQIDCPFEGPVHTECGYSLAPGFVSGEGQYCAALLKNGGVEQSTFCDAVLYSDSDSSRSGKRKEFRRNGSDSRKFPARGASAGKGASAIPEKELAEFFSIPTVLRSRGETIVAVPEVIASDLNVLEVCVKPLAAGVAVGTVKGGKLVPDADLALCTLLKDNAFPNVELDRLTALHYLHRDAIPLPSGTPAGICTVSYLGRRLGFVKNIGSRCNSLHPMSRRILMDVR